MNLRLTRRGERVATGIIITCAIVFGYEFTHVANLISNMIRYIQYMEMCAVTIVSAHIVEILGAAFMGTFIWAGIRNPR